jgi:hypothetical protein
MGSFLGKLLGVIASFHSNSNRCHCVHCIRQGKMLYFKFFEGKLPFKFFKFPWCPQGRGLVKIQFWFAPSSLN